MYFTEASTVILMSDKDAIIASFCIQHQFFKEQHNH